MTAHDGQETGGAWFADLDCRRAVGLWHRLEPQQLTVELVLCNIRTAKTTAHQLPNCPDSQPQVTISGKV
jgi:hypothetical protein